LLKRRWALGEGGGGREGRKGGQSLKIPCCCKIKWKRRGNTINITCTGPFLHEGGKGHGEGGGGCNPDSQSSHVGRGDTKKKTPVYCFLISGEKEKGGEKGGKKCSCPSPLEGGKVFFGERAGRKKKKEAGIYLSLVPGYVTGGRWRVYCLLHEVTLEKEKGREKKEGGSDCNYVSSSLTRRATYGSFHWFHWNIGEESGKRPESISSFPGLQEEDDFSKKKREKEKKGASSVIHNFISW